LVDADTGSKLKPQPAWSFPNASSDDDMKVVLILASISVSNYLANASAVQPSHWSTA